MDAKIAHLEMLQNIVARMANNSFLLKGWSVTLLTGLFALGAANSNGWFFLMAMVPVYAFWYLDGYFLSQERYFRNVYNIVIDKDEDQIDFQMTDTSASFETALSVMWSKTLVWFHGAMMAVAFIAGSLMLWVL